MAREKKSTKVFRASDVQRRYRAVLDGAKKDGLVQILDADGTVLAVERWEEAEFASSLIGWARVAGQFREVYERHRSEPIADWAALTPFPWIDSLHPDEVEEFVDGLAQATLLAAGRDDLSEVIGLVHAFKSTADTYRAPDILAAMLEEGEPEEVFPPSHYGYSSANAASADAA
ncbi:MAG: hypothetical protein ACYDHO_06965 [Gaiellaceae bacterium]